jgi:hypothetical protein
MVVYKKVYTLQDYVVHDDYWKLERHWARSVKTLTAQLQQRNYKVLKLANKDRLVQMLSRHDRGLLSYDGCRVEELRMFCTQRGLSPSAMQRPNKAQLVKMLEQADDKAAFPHFMDLPAELRVHIYILYFGSLPELAQPAQPPISKASRITRTESLPIFYKKCSFVLEMPPVDHSDMFPRLPPPKLSKGEFFSAIREEHLKLTRQLFIEISKQNSLSPRRDSEVGRRHGEDHTTERRRRT